MKWTLENLPSGLRQKNGVHWVAPGVVSEQSDYPDRWVRAYHASQDAAGRWYVVTEQGDGSYEVTGVDINHLNELLDDMRRAAQNTPGVEIWIDNPHREEGADEAEHIRDLKPSPSRHARLSRKKAK